MFGCSDWGHPYGCGCRGPGLGESEYFVSAAQDQYHRQEVEDAALEAETRKAIQAGVTQFVSDVQSAKAKSARELELARRKAQEVATSAPGVSITPWIVGGVLVVGLAAGAWFLIRRST